MRFASFAAAAAIAFAVPASAADFSFSYKHSDTVTITGTISGDKVGNTVTNLSNITMKFNGVDFTGPLVARGSVATPGDGTQCGVAACFSAPAVMSFDPSLNNFLIADYATDAEFSGTNYFYVFPWRNSGEVLGLQAKFNGVLYDSYNGTYQPANWSLTDLSGAVPEPAQWALLIGGFGLVGASARRRRTGVVATVTA